MSKALRFATILFTLVILLALLIVVTPPLRVEAQQIGSQVLLSMKFINGGPRTLGAGVLQTGEITTLTAAVASATRAEVSAAPAAGSIYVRGILVEKSTGAGGTFTLSYGTGTNCGTGTTTLLGPVTNPPVGYVQLGIQVPATKALCLATDAATTSVRALAE